MSLVGKMIFLGSYGLLGVERFQMLKGVLGVGGGKDCSDPAYKDLEGWYNYHEDQKVEEYVVLMKGQSSPEGTWTDDAAFCCTASKCEPIGLHLQCVDIENPDKMRPVQPVFDGDVCGYKSSSGERPFQRFKTEKQYIRKFTTVKTSYVCNDNRWLRPKLSLPGIPRLAAGKKIHMNLSHMLETSTHSSGDPNPGDGVVLVFSGKPEEDKSKVSVAGQFQNCEEVCSAGSVFVPKPPLAWSAQVNLQRLSPVNILKGEKVPDVFDFEPEIGEIQYAILFRELNTVVQSKDVSSAGAPPPTLQVGDVSSIDLSYCRSNECKGSEENSAVTVPEKIGTCKGGTLTLATQDKSFLSGNVNEFIRVPKEKLLAAKGDDIQCFNDHDRENSHYQGSGVVTNLHMDIPRAWGTHPRTYGTQDWRLNELMQPLIVEGNHAGGDGLRTISLFLDHDIITRNLPGH